MELALSVDIPALTRLAKDRNIPIAGKDFKTGQTMMKTILAPGLKSRLLGLNGWFSTIYLGIVMGKFWTILMPLSQSWIPTATWPGTPS
jgi:hypothetical protein